MTYRSMSKTAPDKIQDIDQKNPENTQTQSIQSGDKHTKTHWKAYSSEKETGCHTCGRN